MYVVLDFNSLVYCTDESWFWLNDATRLLSMLRMNKNIVGAKITAMAMENCGKKT